MRMTDNPIIRHNFMFRLGELHIVFAMLKVLGKFIIDSGLDDIFSETRIYCPTNFGQIIERKHMKICLKAYFTLHLALSTILFGIVLTFDNEKWTELKADFLRLTNSFLFLNQLNAFCPSFTYQAKYIYSFMKVLEILILFIRGF